MLTDDQKPWLDVARDVIKGKYLHADSSLKKSLAIGLRAVKLPLTELALKRLSNKKSCAETKE